MISIFNSSANGILTKLNPETINDLEISLVNKWIHLTNPTDKEVEDVVRRTGAPEDFIKAALDEEETAHLDRDEGYNLVLFDVPIIEEMGDYSFVTIPLGVVSNVDYFITVCLTECAHINDFINGRIKGVETCKKTRFTLQLMYHSSTKFLQYLRQIDKSSQRIQAELHRSMKNKELIQLLGLQKSLVYFSTSLQANDVLVEKIARNTSIKKYQEDDELLQDLQIETKQAIEMSLIYSNILSGTMDAFSSVISNNINIVMRWLTAITFIISIPTLIASLWGMNVPVPWQSSGSGFYIVVAICLVSGGVSAFFLFRRKKEKK